MNICFEEEIRSKNKEKTQLCFNCSVNSARSEASFSVGGSSVPSSCMSPDEEDDQIKLYKVSTMLSYFSLRKLSKCIKQEGLRN